MNEDFDIRREMSSAEKDFENALRPLRFHDFSGQKKVVENLEVFVEAAKYRGEPLDHTLLHGPPGLGSTVLQDSERQHSRTSSPMNWAWGSRLPAVRCWISRAT